MRRLLQTRRCATLLRTRVRTVIFGAAHRQA